MTDIILGMGEVGRTLFNLLSERKIDCIGIDIDASKCDSYSEKSGVKNPEFLHICIPGELHEFIDVTINWINEFKDLKTIIIHSTVKPGTTKKFKIKLKFQFYFLQFAGYTKDF